MTRHAMMGFHRGVHELLGCLLELLFGCLRIRACWPRLVLNFDVDRLTIWPGLLSSSLRLGRLVTTIHGVIHHTPVKWITILLLLIIVLLARNNRAPDYPESTAVL